MLTQGPDDSGLFIIPIQNLIPYQMNKKIQSAAFLLLCAVVIALAIHAGEKHSHCRECSLAIAH